MRAVCCLLAVFALFPGCGKWLRTSRHAPPAEGLAAGRRAPEIQGTDLEGVAFKLSDYRGKVVVLDFWGQWCTHCRAMYPHERSLVARYQGRPFVFLGINSDDDREYIKAVMTRESLPWRCWWDGGTSGPIANRYRVNGWPTIYVLDAQGVIRFVQVRGGNLDEAVETLVREAESKKI